MAGTNYNIGIIHKKHGNIKEAQKAFEKSTNLNPGHIYSHKELAKILLENGQKDKAINSLYAAIKYDDDFVGAHLCFPR